ncbi:FK506-binding protein 15-like isoform X2 [Ornithodoros turicata]|uniref:FK506-binding protein 15-like isoform X2 n=1 Tax=Ornithodoros turicata TaxID=34597 RepID=UPI0031389665
MLFGNDDDDLDFTVQPGSSKLASLFVSTANSAGESSALTYTAPRQPSTKTNGNQNAATMSLLHAAAVHAFKFENGKHVNQGKLGFAVVGHHGSAVYKLILYKGKQQQVTTATINTQFLFLVQPKGYVNFCDDSRSNWSVKFESEQNLVDMAKQVALAKANSAASSLNGVIIQDLTLGEGQGLENGCLAVLKYTGWLLTDHGFGKVFDSNADTEQPLKVKLGKGKVIKGWEEGLIGAKKHGRRLLVIPASLGYGSQGYGSAVPPNSTLIFEVCITKVKQSRDNTRSSTPVLNVVGDCDNSSRPESRSASQSTDDSIRARGASISEQLQATTSAESEKARIISRMAKMGTQMLPLKGAVAAQPSSESENEDELQQRLAVTPPPPQAALRSESPKPPVKPRSVHTLVTQSLPQSAPLSGPTSFQSVPPTQQMAVFQNQTQFPGAMASYGYQPVIYPQQYQAPQLATVAPSVAESQVPLLLSEARSQGTEMRHNLGKISDKVDMVLSKLDTLRPQSSVSMMGPYMDSEMLLSNIQRIVQENVKLKEESQEKNNKIQALNDKVYDLLQRNQRFMEESHNMMEQRSDSLQSSAAQSQARFLELEKEKLEVMSRLNEALLQVSSLKGELEEKQRRDSQMQEVLNSTIAESQKKFADLEELRTRSQEKENVLAELRTRIKEVEQQKLELESRLMKSEEQVSVLEHTKEDLEKALAEAKQKAAEEKQKTQEVMANLRMSHEAEIGVLQNKLRDGASAAPSSEETEARVRSEYEERLAEREKTYSQHIELLEVEKRKLQEKLRDFASKVEKAESEQVPNQLLSELQKEVQDLQAWKTKYEELSRSTDSLKKSYDEQIRGLMSENKNLRSTCASPVAGQSPSIDFEAELKKIMNTLFRLLQKEFDGTGTYSKNEVVQIILDVIREYTTQVITVKRSQTPVPVATGSETDAGSSSSVSQVPQQTKIEEMAPVAPKVGSESNTETGVKTTSEESTKAEGSQIGEVESSATMEHTTASEHSNTCREEAHLKQEQDTEATSDNPNIRAETDAALAVQNAVGTQENEAQVDSKAVTKREPDWSWKPQPPPPPLFDDDDEDEDDWLK